MVVLAVVLLMLGHPGSASAPPVPHKAPDLAKLRQLTAPLVAPSLGLAPVPWLEPSSQAASPADAPGDCGQAADAADQFGAAMLVPTPIACDGSLDANDTYDFFKVHLDAHWLVVVNVTPAEGASIQTCLANPGRLVFWCDTAHQATYVTDEPGLWFVVLIGAAGYHFEIDADPAPGLEGDCGAGDAANVREAPTALAWPVECDGHTRFLDDIIDWFALDDAGGPVLFSLDSAKPGVTCLFLADDLLNASSCANIGPQAPAFFAADTPGHGGYVVVIFIPSASSYHLSIVNAPAQDDCGSGIDAPGHPTLALALSAPGVCLGALALGDQVDVYRVHLPAGQAMGALASFDPNVSAMVCVLPPLGAPFAPQSCEIAWSGGSGITLAGAPAGPERDMVVAVVALGVTGYQLTLDLHAPTPQDDCATGDDAMQQLFNGTPTTLPLDCMGEILAPDGDVWDFYRVTPTRGPIYATLEPNAAADFDLCILTEQFDGLCSTSWGEGEMEEQDMEWWEGDAIIAVLRSSGSGSYHLRVEQQDDCGTGIDAQLEPAALVDDPFVRCDGLLHPLLGDMEDALVLPPPAFPGLTRVHLEPWDARVTVCVDGPVVPLVPTRCTSITYESVFVARDPLTPLHLTIEAHTVQPQTYTLIVEDVLALHAPALT